MLPAGPPTPAAAPPLYSAQGKERYVFFSFPHIAIDSNGEVRRWLSCSGSYRLSPPLRS